MRDLHAFFTVTQCGSMAKAAEQLGISQPAISKVIADLESAFGVRLLDRGRKGVEPTSYGAALLRRSVAAFDELKQSVRDIEFLSDPAKGEVKIQCHESFAATILPRLIRRFSAIYPHVVLVTGRCSARAQNDWQTSSAGEHEPQARRPRSRPLLAGRCAICS